MQEDFKRDATGTESLSYDAFFSSMFELADIWVPDIDARLRAFLESHLPA